MNLMDYRWMKAPRGLYIDGHEREDVVRYRQDVFLPRMAEIEVGLRLWAKDGSEIPRTLPTGVMPRCMWYQDEVQFYRNDRQEV